MNIGQRLDKARIHSGAKKRWIGGLIFGMALTPSVVLICSSVRVWAQEEIESNVEVEERFHQIFEKFHSKKMSEEEWKEIVGSREAEKYTIQPGDTLWDLSQTFFGSGYFWPKLWQVNGDIVNPHLISPGKTIHFVGGTMDEAPQIHVVGNEENANQVEAPLAEIEEKATEEPPNFEAENTPSRFVLKDIPPSLPAMDGTSGTGKYDIYGFQLEPDHDVPKKEYSTVPYYISEKEPGAVGEVTGFSDGQSTGFLNGEVYCTCEGARPGDHLTIYSTLRRVKDPETSDVAGWAIRVSGEVEVTGLRDSKSAVGRIVRQVEQIHIGDSVMTGKLPRFPVDKGRALDTHGKIIAVANADKIIAGIRSVVFLNIGMTQGLRQGDIIPIRRTSDERLDSDRTGGKLGFVRVIHTQKNVSTAILEPYDMVMVGDQVGSTASVSQKSGSIEDDAVSSEEKIE